MKKKGVLLILTVILVFGIAQVASAAGGPGAGDKMGPGNWSNIVDKLGLTADQVDQLSKIQDDAYNQTRDLRIQMMDLNHELRQLMLQGDQDQIQAKQDEIQQVRSQIQDIMQQSMQQCKSLLTDDQLAKIKDFQGHGPGQGQGQGWGMHGVRGHGGVCPGCPNAESDD